MWERIRHKSYCAIAFAKYKLGWTEHGCFFIVLTWLKDWSLTLLVLRSAYIASVFFIKHTGRGFDLSIQVSLRAQQVLQQSFWEKEDRNIYPRLSESQWSPAQRWEMFAFLFNSMMCLFTMRNGSQHSTQQCRIIVDREVMAMEKKPS